MKTIIIGLGNPILGDDGVGWRVAERIAEQIPSLEGEKITVDCLSVGGLSLMENLIGYDKAIIIDALMTGQKPNGTVSSFPIEDLPNRALGHLSSAHDTTLQNALVVGRSMDAKLPHQIQIVGIEAEFVFDFSEQLSSPVAAAVPAAVQEVLNLLQKENRP